MPRMSSRFLRAAVLLPVLLVSLAATSYATWRCRFDGMARSGCCCPKEQATTSQAPEAGATVIKSPECCIVEQHQVEKSPSAISRGNPVLVEVTSLAVPIAILPAVSAEVVRGLAVDLPRPPGGRAIVVQKQAFLI